MQSGVKSYTNYAAQIEKMVAFVRSCFPRAAVLVLGSQRPFDEDRRGLRTDGRHSYMLDVQRQAARNTGAAFGPRATPCAHKGAWSSS